MTDADGNRTDLAAEVVDHRAARPRPDPDGGLRPMAQGWLTEINDWSPARWARRTG